MSLAAATAGMAFGPVPVRFGFCGCRQGETRVVAPEAMSAWGGKRQQILLGTLGSVYEEKGEVGAYTAVWMDVMREETVGGNGRFPGLADLSPLRETMAALWQVRVLDKVVETSEGLVVYPTGLEPKSA